MKVGWILYHQNLQGSCWGVPSATTRIRRLPSKSPFYWMVTLILILGLPMIYAEIVMGHRQDNVSLTPENSCTIVIVLKHALIGCPLPSGEILLPLVFRIESGRVEEEKRPEGPSVNRFILQFSHSALNLISLLSLLTGIHISSLLVQIFLVIGISPTWLMYADAATKGDILQIFPVLIHR